jgi:hypothetical protein
MWILVALLTGPVVAEAQVTMTYQGQLSDAAERPVSGTRQVTYRMYNAAEAGEAIWQEVHAEVDVVGGAFYSVLGLREALPGGATPLFLGVQVAAEVEFTPRMVVGGALRAQWAAVAEQANDVRGRDIHPRTVSIGDRAVIDEEGRWVGADMECMPGTFLYSAGERVGKLVRWAQLHVGFFSIYGQVPVRVQVLHGLFGVHRSRIAFVGPDCSGQGLATDGWAEIELGFALIGPNGHLWRVVGSVTRVEREIVAEHRGQSELTAEGCVPFQGDVVLNYLVELVPGGPFREPPEPVYMRMNF